MTCVKSSFVVSDRFLSAKRVLCLQIAFAISFSALSLYAQEETGEVQSSGEEAPKEIKAVFPKKKLELQQQSEKRVQLAQEKTNAPYFQSKEEAAEAIKKQVQADIEKRKSEAAQKQAGTPTPASPKPQPKAQTPASPASSKPANSQGQNGDEKKPSEGGKIKKVTDDRKKEIDKERANAKGIKINIKDADILEVIETVSAHTKKNFIIPQNMKKAKVTMLSPTEISVDELWSAFLSILEVNDLALVESGGYYKVLNARDTIQQPIPLYTGGKTKMPIDDQMVTWLCRLEYVDSNTIMPTIKALGSKNGLVMAYTPTNTLIISDTASNMVKIQEIIKQLDVQSGGEDVFLIEIKYATAQDIADKVTKIFDVRNTASAPAGKAKKEGEEETVTLSKVIADERTNKLIIIATERSYQKVKSLIKKLDVPVEGEGEIHVVYLSYADAEKVAQTLTQLAQGAQARKQGGAPVKPGATGELFEGEIKISADKSTNSLVIVANQSDFKNLSQIIDKLDIIRKQVYVEAVILEIGLDRENKMGLAFSAGAIKQVGGEDVPIFFGTNYGSLNSVMVDPTSLASLLGFVGGVRGPEVEGSAETFGVGLPSFGALLQALKTNSDVNVLSTPHILTTDNEEAVIIVGENVPFQSGFTTSLGGLSGAQGISGYSFNPIVSIQRQDVALTLKIKPQISAGETVKMTIEEEVSEIARESQLLGPTTSKRSAKTVVTMNDQQTVVIGGLIRNRVSSNDTKIPFLGDIPVIGWLFRSSDRKTTKTNLLLLLTPYIIRSQADFKAIFDRKMKERQEFIENFYGGDKNDYEAYYDFDRIPGPVSDLKKEISKEMEKAENGGPGTSDEYIVRPAKNEGEGKTDEKPNDNTDELGMPSDSETGDKTDEGEDSSEGEKKNKLEDTDDGESRLEERIEGGGMVRGGGVVEESGGGQRVNVKTKNRKKPSAPVEGNFEKMPQYNLEGSKIITPPPPGANPQGGQ